MRLKPVLPNKPHSGAVLSAPFLIVYQLTLKIVIRHQKKRHRIFLP